MMCHYINGGKLIDPMPERYPSREEILASPGPLFRKGLFKKISAWKEDWYRKWSERDLEGRLYALQRLITVICGAYGVPRVTILKGSTDAYLNSGIILSSSGSVLSALHELGHHLFGGSEYHACRFSVWLYQRMFPTSFSNLIWSETPGSEHVLVLRSSLEPAP